MSDFDSGGSMLNDGNVANENAGTNNNLLNDGNATPDANHTAVKGSDEPAALEFSKYNSAEHPELSNYKSPDDVFTDLLKYKAEAGKSPLRPLSENSSPEEIEQFNNGLRTLLGVPETPEGYGTLGYDESQIADNPLFSGYAAAAHKYNLSPEQAKGFAHDMDVVISDIRTQQMAKDEEAITAYRERERANLVKELGSPEAYKELTQSARNAIRAAATGAKIPSEVLKSFESTFGDHPAVLKMFGYFGTHFSEQQIVFPSTGTPKVDESAEADAYFKNLFPDSN